MGDVKRYTYRYSEVDGELHRVEEPDGHFVLHTDYTALLARHNALVIEHAALLINHNALVEAVKTLRSLEGGIPEIGMLGAHKMITDVARAEVDRLLGEG